MLASTGICEAYHYSHVWFCVNSLLDSIQCLIQLCFSHPQDAYTHRPREDALALLVHTTMAKQMCANRPPRNGPPLAGSQGSGYIRKILFACRAQINAKRKNSVQYPLTFMIHTLTGLRTWPAPTPHMSDGRQVGAGELKVMWARQFD